MGEGATAAVPNPHGSAAAVPNPHGIRSQTARREDEADAVLLLLRFLMSAWPQVLRAV